MVIVCITKLIIIYCKLTNSKLSKSEGLPKRFFRKKLSNFTHDSVYGALCTISVQKNYF